MYMTKRSLTKIIGKPLSMSFFRNKLCQTLPKAFDMSINTRTMSSKIINGFYSHPSTHISRYFRLIAEFKLIKSKVILEYWSKQRFWEGGYLKLLKDNFHLNILTEFILTMGISVDIIMEDETYPWIKNTTNNFDWRLLKIGGANLSKS